MEQRRPAWARTWLARAGLGRAGLGQTWTGHSTVLDMLLLQDTGRKELLLKGWPKATLKPLHMDLD